jgi:hypothetical protein
MVSYATVLVGRCHDEVVRDDCETAKGSPICFARRVAYHDNLHISLFDRYPNNKSSCQRVQYQDTNKHCVDVIATSALFDCI